MVGVIAVVASHSLGVLNVALMCPDYVALERAQCVAIYCNRKRDFFFLYDYRDLSLQTCTYYILVAYI